MEKGKSPGVDGEKKEVGLERSRSSSDLRGSPSCLRQPEGVPCQDQSQLVIPYKQPGLLRTSHAEGSNALMRAKSRSSWELSRSWEDGEKGNSCMSSSNSRGDSSSSCQKSRSREGKSSSKSSCSQKSSSCEGNSSSKNSSSSQMSNRWEGNSSGESSKSSSPEPESEFLRVFAQLRAARPLAV
jgi:hypothetical protein